ncbi:hypothetical protein PGB90_003378 [Kerria lacca]
MCGIWAIFGVETTNYEKYERAFHQIRHRGPDALRFQYENEIEKAFFGFHRLSIVCTPFGIQPMRLYQHSTVNLLCNGEIYNCHNLAKEFNFKYETGSDVECIIHLFQKLGIEKCAQQLDGVYAFCLVDLHTRTVYIARDPFGVRPLFRLVTSAGILGISSEAKGLIDITKTFGDVKWYIEQFPPGCYAKYRIGLDFKCKLVEEKRFYQIGKLPWFKPWFKHENVIEDIGCNIRNLLTAAVEKRLMSDRRIGCLLSGGLDSSLISAILVKLTKEKNIPYRVQSFSIGMGDDSPDLLAAREVAKFIDSEHHEIIFTENDVIEILDKVIYSVESCDITTIRASIGMFLISKYIKENTDTTVIFSGEGADELAQGYIYFKDAPTNEEGNEESLKLLSEIYLFDGLRADRTTSAHSLELRVPFLDLQFTNYFLNLPSQLRKPRDGFIEKYLIRSAFNCTDLLPQCILWRPKEAFSDGVTHKKRSLFNIIQEWVEHVVSDTEFAKASEDYPYLTPPTKEAYYYRKIFEKYYPGQVKNLVPHYWMPRWTDVMDPSARFIEHYAA